MDQRITSTSYTPGTPLTLERTYYWRVRAIDDSNQTGDWSAVYAFTLSWGAVSGLNPADGTIVSDTTPLFSWDAVPGAVKYDIQIAATPDGFANPSTRGETLAPSTTYQLVSFLPNLQTWYWRVRAVDTNSITGLWSTAQAFTVEWGSLSGLLPADGLKTMDTTPQFQWNRGVRCRQVRSADIRQSR